MNLEEQLKPIVEKAIEVAEKTGEFALEQAPILLQEFYLWHITEKCAYILFSIIIFFSPLLVRKILPKEESSYYVNFLGKKVDEDYGIPAQIICLISAVLSIILFFSSVMSLLKITVAPKLYLIEYFLK